MFEIPGDQLSATTGRQAKTRAARISWLHYLSAWGRGLDLGDYARARQTATHKEVLEAEGVGVFDLDHYSAAREAGADHAEALAAQELGIRLAAYADARGVGADHAQVVEAHNEGVDLRDYAKARGHVTSSSWLTARPVPEPDATHSEVMEAHAMGIRTASYATARREHGASHGVALTGHAHGIDVAACAAALDRGASHAQILAVLARGVEIFAYARAVGTEVPPRAGPGRPRSRHRRRCLRLCAGGGSRSCGRPRRPRPRCGRR
ncbi:hypothetical protein BKA00_002893 [Actinomadura coerulea]|uniref:Uncharacterized protein n=1 Tax=Actinomadura coerulea TaxID=46159 RepID=A0A7X0FYA3_9ACTN|nr:hypothetical protein [Actinomadura coerulea]MBB6395979.1 hypothetical protein [Actinomadura coerulea]GGQ30760.1 hypothetical protein GCM10010187_54550 [Actinomadura coerulea]